MKLLYFLTIIIKQNTGLVINKTVTYNTKFSIKSKNFN